MDKLSDVARPRVVRVIGLSREVCVLELVRVVDKVWSGSYDSQGVLGGQVGQGSQKVRVFWIV